MTMSRLLSHTVSKKGFDVIMSDEMNLNEHKMAEPVGLDSHGIGSPLSDNSFADGEYMKKFMESLNEVFSDGYVAMSEDMKREGELQAARSLIVGSEFSVDEYMENMGNNLVYADPQHENGNQGFSLASVEAMRNHVEPVELLAARKGMSVSEFVTQDLMEKVQDYVDYARESSGNPNAMDTIMRNFVNTRSRENYDTIDEYLQSDEFAEYAKQYGEAVEAQCAENHGLSHEEYKEVYPDIMKDKLGDDYGVYGGRDSEAFDWSNYKFSDDKDVSDEKGEPDAWTPIKDRDWNGSTIEWNEQHDTSEPSEKVNDWDKQMNTPEESGQVDWNTTKDVEDSGKTVDWNKGPISPEGSDADTKSAPEEGHKTLNPTKIEFLDSPEAGDAQTDKPEVDGTQTESPKVRIKLKDPELGDTEKGTTIHIHSSKPDLTHDVAHPHFDPAFKPSFDPAFKPNFGSAFNGGEMEKMLAGMRDGMKSTKSVAEGLAAMAAGGDKDKGADGPSLSSIGMDFA